MESPQLLWQHPTWPGMRYDGPQVAAAVAEARRAQGRVEGQLAALGFKARQQLAAEAWVQEAMSTAAIEGEQLDLLAVRSSIARRLGVAHGKGPHAARHVDGLLDIMDDAVTHATAPLTHERLQAWQAALFPTGYSGMRKVRVGGYRQHGEPMQIVSGPLGRETVHYEAPPSSSVPDEMTRFLAWFNDDTGSQGTAGPPQVSLTPSGGGLGLARPWGRSDSLVQAALAHLWFETIHPFEDGNGRVGRVIVDLILARDAGVASRLFRISQRLLENRDAYYAELERAQHGPLDVTPWVVWFVSQLRLACEQTSGVIELALAKARFWSVHHDKDLNARQRKAVNSLLDAGPGGFEGGMSTRKYESLASTSRATASRELIELVSLGLLVAVGAGRSTRYRINLEGWVA